MKNLFFIFFTIITIATIFYSCSKYEEGPKISLLTKKARLTSYWELSKIEGGELLDIILYEKNLNLKKDGTGIASMTNAMSNNTREINITWEFTDKKEMLKIDYHYNASFEYIFTDGSLKSTIGIVSKKLEILKLKNNEMWLKDHFGIIYKFKKK